MSEPGAFAQILPLSFRVAVNSMNPPFILGLILVAVLTAAPTLGQQVIDLNPGAEGSTPLSAYVTDYEPHRLFFSAEHNAHGRELWLSDGTPDGTRFVANLTSDARSSSPGSFVVLGSHVVFLSNEGGGTGGVWRTDGTATGTSLLASLLARPLGTTNGWFYFHTYPSDGSRVYRTDGVSVEAVSVPGSTPGSPVGVTSTHAFTASFVFEGGGYGEVFATDLATGQTTGLLGTQQQRWSALIASGIRKFAVAHDRLYFAAFLPQEGDINIGDLAVWVTDGTPEGTAYAFDVPWPHGADNVNNNVELNVAGGLLYLATREAGLWAISDASAPAVQVAASSAMAKVFPFGNQALTTLYDSAFTGIALLDGDALVPIRPNVVASEFVAVSDSAGFFVGQLVGSSTRRLWFTNGTEAGTFPAIPAAGLERLTGEPRLLGRAGTTVLYSGDATRVVNDVEVPLGHELWLGPAPDAVVPLAVLPSDEPVTYDGGPTGADVTLIQVPTNPFLDGAIVHYGGGFSVSGRKYGKASEPEIAQRWTLNLPGIESFGEASALTIRLDDLEGPLPDPATLTVMFQRETEDPALTPTPVPLPTTYDAGTRSLTATGFGAPGHFSLGYSKGVSVESEQSLPASLGVYPNPTQGHATVVLKRDAPGACRVEVFDILGRRVAVLHDGHLAAGRHELSLEASRLPAGIYVVRAALPGGASITRRLTVLR